MCNHQFLALHLIFEFANFSIRYRSTVVFYNEIALVRLSDLQTKNGASNRTMPMFDLTKQILLKYKDHDQTKRIYEKVNAKTLSMKLIKLLKQNDLPRLTLHELRHTFITRCHEKKIDEIVIQKWVGHAIGSKMTKAVYTHIMDTAETKYIESMNGN